MLTAMMEILVPQISVIIPRLRTLSALIPMNQPGLVVGPVSNVMEMAIVSIDQMVIILANAELVVRDVFMAFVKITIQPVPEPKPVANVNQILV